MPVHIGGFLGATTTVELSAVDIAQRAEKESGDPDKRRYLK